MLREIERTSPHYSDITQTFAHILHVTNENTPDEQVLRVQNPYAYGSPEMADHAERSQRLLLGAVALVNNMHPPFPNELVDRVQAMRLAEAHENGIQFAATFLSPPQARHVLETVFYDAKPSDLHIS